MLPLIPHTHPLLCEVLFLESPQTLYLHLECNTKFQFSTS
jgi:hypothetical protein